ncbi:MAG: GerAB/ArcD/ProY family transporter [Clostridia bacterium]
MQKIINKNEIKITQIAMIIVVIMAGSKFLNVLTLIAAEAKQDGWLTLLLIYAVDYIALFCMLYAIKINTKGLSLYEVLKSTIGIVATKIIFAMFFAYYMFRIMGLMTSVLNVFSATLTLKTNWLGFAIPIAIYIIVATKLGIKATARITELLGGAIILAAVLMITLSIKQTDLTELKPVLVNGFTPVFKAINDHTFWFADSLFIVFMIENVKGKKSFYLVPTVAFIVGVVMTIGLYAVFYGIFGPITWMIDGAIDKVSQFNVQLTSNGRLDWLALVFWLLSVFIKLAIMSFCAFKSFDSIFIKSTKSPSIVAITVYCALIVILPILFPMEACIRFLFRNGAGKYAALILQYLVPFLLPFLTKYATKKSKTLIKKSIVALE